MSGTAQPAETRADADRVRREQLEKMTEAQLASEIERVGETVNPKATRNVAEVVTMRVLVKALKGRKRLPQAGE